jgi:hypothetical protein
MQLLFSVGWHENIFVFSEIQTIGEKTVVVYFKVLSRHWPAGAEEITKHLRQDRLCPRQGSHRTCPKHKTEELPLEQLSLFSNKHVWQIFRCVTMFAP